MRSAALIRQSSAGIIGKFSLAASNNCAAVLISASLSFSAGLSTNYSNGADFGYFKQFNNNLGKSIGINLNIPIFNHLAVYNQVKLAKLDLESAKFQKDISLNELRAETAKAVFNLNNVSNNIVQLQEQQQSYSESFRIAQVHFEAGK